MSQARKAICIWLVHLAAPPGYQSIRKLSRLERNLPRPGLHAGDPASSVLLRRCFPEGWRRAKMQMMQTLIERKAARTRTEFTHTPRPNQLATPHRIAPNSPFSAARHRSVIKNEAAPRLRIEHSLLQSGCCMRFQHIPASCPRFQIKHPVVAGIPQMTVVGLGKTTWSLHHGACEVWLLLFGSAGQKSPGSQARARLARKRSFASPYPALTHQPVERKALAQI